MIADVIFHELSHQAINGAARCGEALEYVSTRLILIQSAQHALKLADNFLGAVYQVQFFSRSMGHFN